MLKKIAFICFRKKNSKLKRFFLKKNYLLNYNDFKGTFFLFFKASYCSLNSSSSLSALTASSSRFSAFLNSLFSIDQ